MTCLRLWAFAVLVAIITSFAIAFVPFALLMGLAVLAFMFMMMPILIMIRQIMRRFAIVKMFAPFACPAVWLFQKKGLCIWKKNNIGFLSMSEANTSGFFACEKIKSTAVSGLPEVKPLLVRNAFLLRLN